MDKQHIPLEVVSFADTPRNLQVNGNRFEIANDASLLMLRTAAEGGAIPSIEFDAEVFTNGPNKNKFHFYDDDIASLAMSLKGKPFLKNHGQRDTDERLGTIVNAWNEGNKIFETIKITTKNGILDFVEGKIDRFSIGVFSDGADCSICGFDLLDHNLCQHYVGARYDGIECNAILRKPEGIETSAVNVPAVDGTHILANLTASKQKFLEEKELSMKDEELEQEEEGTPQEGATNQGEQQPVEEAAAILALTMIAEDEEANAWMAEAMNLTDMDRRIGELEQENAKLKADIERLAAFIDEQNGLGIYVQRPWQGIKSARENLETAGETHTPKPERPVRKPHDMKADKGKPRGTFTPRQKSGAAFIGKLKGGSQ